MQPVRIQVLEQDGSNHPGLAKGAKPLRLHRYFRGSLVLKFYLLGQVVQFSLWGGQGIVPRTMSMGKRGKLAARSVAAVWQPVNSWSISRACLHLNTQAQTNFSKPHPKVFRPFALRLILAQLRMKQDYWRKYQLIVGRLLSPTIVVSLRRPVSLEQADR